MQGNSHTIRWSNGYTMVWTPDSDGLRFFCTDQDGQLIGVRAGLDEKTLRDLVKYFQSWLGAQADKKSESQESK